MRVSLEAAKTALKQSFDLRLWTRQYPWLLTGAALAAGAVAAIKLVPPPRTPAEKRRARRLRERARYEAAYVHAAAKMEEERLRKSDWRKAWRQDLGSALRRAVSSLLVAAIASKTGVRADGRVRRDEHASSAR